MGWQGHMLPWFLGLILVLQSANTFDQYDYALSGHHGQGCTSEQFECYSGECISDRLHCDGHPDCMDNSDEDHLNCDLILCRGSSWFRCNNQRCVSSTFVCDTEDDCGDFSDEKDCQKREPHECTHLEFQCVMDSVCIPSSWACNGHTDCFDGSDEVAGCVDKKICNGGFLCNSTQFCIAAQSRCDGETDCADGSDEQNCPNTTVSHIDEDCTVENHKFLCKDKSNCVNLDKLCDHNPDCTDKSDEGGHCFDANACSIHCSSSCKITPDGPICICPLGSHLNGTECVDTDECLTYGICDQQCINIKDGYHCTCEPGYKLQSDKKTCKTEDGEGLLLFSGQSEIRGYYLSSGTYFQVVNHLTKVIGLSYDGHDVYWTDVYNEQPNIARLQLDGSDIKTVVNSGLGIPEDLAVDLVTKNIYFTDAQMKHIGVCRNDGLACVVLHNRDVDKPKAIALQPKNGLMYWSDWGSKPMIARSGMDGSEVTEFVTSNIMWPTGIALDHGNGRLYWVDARHLTIESIKFDGTDRRLVSKDGINDPISLAVFEDSLYWSTLDGNEILACDKFTGKNVRPVIRERIDKISSIHIYHESMRTLAAIENPCEESGCSDICLLAPLSSKPLRYSCACSGDKILSYNGHYCNKGKSGQSVVVGWGNAIIEIDTKHLGKQSPVKVELPDVEKIGVMAFDSLSGNIIIFDTSAKKFFSLNLEQAHTTLLLSGDVGTVEGLDIDPFGNNMYWVDSERMTVEVMSLRTFKRTVLIRDLGGDVPTDIALAPKQGYMFIALSGPRGSHIDRFYMNGLARMHMVDHNLIGPSTHLAFDSISNQLFWSDAGSGYIERADVSGSERHSFIQLEETPMSIATLQDDVFWVSHSSRTLSFTSKFDEQASIKKLILDFEIGWGSLEIAAVKQQVAAQGHPCQNNNGGCSHFCFVTPLSFVCGCPYGMTLEADGRTCEKPVLCKQGEFRCKTGECIAESLHCNHKPDCPQGDDESDCTRYIIQCPKGQFQCNDGEKCVEEHTRCDGYSDCQDKSDEMHCHIHNATCAQGYFQCDSGECIDVRMRCDTHHDCKDSSDEFDCEHNTCSPTNDFRCHNGVCLPISWECDGTVDCADGSDEHALCAPKGCSTYQFMCSNGRCVEHELVCDGFSDCEDFSDEASCTYNEEMEDNIRIIEVEPSHVDDSVPPVVEHKCEASEFKCDSQPGVCLPLAVKCNGSSECLRGEDETNCSGCFHTEFECVENKRCIQRDWICDGTNDCGDSSDEDPTMCRFHNRSTPVQNHVVVQCKNFECKNRQQCLAYSQVCDGHPDCTDGSDEGGRCDQACMNSGCQEICLKTPYGPHCECPSGYQLMGDGRRCADIDECRQGTFCSQYCDNTPGTFHCSCKYPDYMLKEDRMSCKAIGPRMQYIYALENQIRYITQTHSVVGLIYDSRGTELRVSGLDVNARKKLVFWSSDLFGTLTKIHLENKKEMEVITNLVRPTRLSVDWVTGNVYFIENYSKIKVCHFGNQKCALIYTAKPNVKIGAITVDPITRFMFWTEETTSSHANFIDQLTPTSGIKRADLAGIDPIMIVDLATQRITDVIVDPVHEVVYWLEAYHGKVERSLCNGTNKQTIFQTPDIPVEIGLFEENIYWLVKGSNPQRQRELEIYGNVWHCGLSGPKLWMCDVIKISPKNMLGRPYQFKIMHEALQPEVKDPCSLVNCTHLCVLTEKGTTCLCDDGVHVHPGQMCKAVNATVEKFKKETIITKKAKPFMSWWVLGLIIFMFIVLPTTVGVFYFMHQDVMRWCCRDRPSKFMFPSFHFHTNPTYDNGLSHRESSFHHERLDPGQHQYENPIINKLSEVSIVSSEMSQIPNLKKVEFHLTDIPDDDSSVEYSDTLMESHKSPLIH